MSFGDILWLFLRAAFIGTLVPVLFDSGWVLGAVILSTQVWFGFTIWTDLSRFWRSRTASTPPDFKDLP